mgnify:CR=1 FL=1
MQITDSSSLEEPLFTKQPKDLIISHLQSKIHEETPSEEERTNAVFKKILIAGNGGSAADAQHFAAELVGRYGFDRPSLPSIALTTDTSNLTAIGNDYGYDYVFSRQLEGLGQEGDLFIGISSSNGMVFAIKTD